MQRMVGVKKLVVYFTPAQNDEWLFGREINYAMHLAIVFGQHVNILSQLHKTLQTELCHRADQNQHQGQALQNRLV